MGTLFVECSAKTNQGVQEAFEELVTRVSLLIFLMRPHEKIVETPALFEKTSQAIRDPAALRTIKLGAEGKEAGGWGVPSCAC